MDGTYSMYDEMRNAYTILVGKSQGRRPHERPGSTRKSNIKMHHREIQRNSVG